MDFRNKSNVRGMRNNNAGNLRPAKMLYQKQIGLDSGGHAIFADMSDGLEYMLKDLIYKISQRTPKLDTISKFVSVYAPSSDGNNEAAYRKFLSSETGLKETQIIPLDTTTLTKFANAIVAMEVGATNADKIPNEDYVKGYNVALTKYSLPPIKDKGSGTNNGLFVISAIVFTSITFLVKKFKSRSRNV